MKILDKLWYWIYCYGYYSGLTLVLIVLLWDFAWTGGRNLLHYSICWKGVLVMLTGLILMLMGGIDER